MIQTKPYNFTDGRIGTKHYSDKLYKTIEVDKVDENGNIVLNEQGQPVKEMKSIYYYIRNKTTGGVYSEAIDILPYEYDELTEEEMSEQNLGE